MIINDIEIIKPVNSLKINEKNRVIKQKNWGIKIFKIVNLIPFIKYMYIPDIIKEIIKEVINEV